MKVKVFEWAWLSWRQSGGYFYCSNVITFTFLLLVLSFIMGCLQYLIRGRLTWKCSCNKYSNVNKAFSSSQDKQFNNMRKTANYRVIRLSSFCIILCVLFRIICILCYSVATCKPEALGKSDLVAGLNKWLIDWLDSIRNSCVVLTLSTGKASLMWAKQWS